MTRIAPFSAFGLFAFAQALVTFPLDPAQWAAWGNGAYGQFPPPPIYLDSMGALSADFPVMTADAQTCATWDIRSPFTYPDGCQTLNGLVFQFVNPGFCTSTRTCAVSLSKYGGVSFNFTLAETGSPSWNWQFESTNVCYPPPVSNGRPGTATISFQSFYNKQWYSWWSVNRLDLSAGTFALSQQFKPDQWSDVNGQLGSANQANRNAFAKAVANVQWIGLVFGGGCFDGHGLDTSGGTYHIGITSGGLQ